MIYLTQLKQIHEKGLGTLLETTRILTNLRKLNQKSIRLKRNPTLNLHTTNKRQENINNQRRVVRIRIYSTRVDKVGHVARTGETRNAHRILVGNAEGKRPLGRAGRRWVDDIKMDLGERGWDGMDWIDLAQDRDQWRLL
jgi:hypothetical protein